MFDPFCGCATTLVVADRLQREWTGIDISEKAAELVVERIKADQGLFQKIIARTEVPSTISQHRDESGSVGKPNLPSLVERFKLTPMVQLYSPHRHSIFFQDT